MSLSVLGRSRQFLAVAALTDAHRILSGGIGVGASENPSLVM